MYTTIYQTKTKKRKGLNKGREVIEDNVYQTKSLTPMHERIRQAYGGTTYQGGKLWYFSFPLLPHMQGATVVASEPCKLNQQQTSEAI